MARSFAELPAGVKVEPARPTIRKGEAGTNFRLRAAGHAALGTFTAKVTGHPAAGADATHDFKFMVAKK